MTVVAAGFHQLSFFSVKRFVGGFMDLCSFGLCNVHQKSSEEKAVFSAPIPVADVFI